MREKIEDAKGRAKQKLGKLTGDKRLERAGKLDRASAAAKTTASRAIDTVKKISLKAGDVLDAVKRTKSADKGRSGRKP